MYYEQPCSTDVGSDSHADLFRVKELPAGDELHQQQGELADTVHRSPSASGATRARRHSARLLKHLKGKRLVLESFFNHFLVTQLGFS
ncbi:hypothetical protein [Micromonospora musae]|uniref:hypothetical protein n=1 Tax=Micromonospora musae TaxID=1894970 RepID=UPI003447CDB5